MDIDEESRKIYARFWNAVDAKLDEAKELKVNTVWYLLFDPGGKDITKAAEVLAEIGF